MSSKEAYYFSHDSNARNDEKILAVRMRLGVEGYGIYFMILERLRDESDNMSIKDYNILAFDFRVSADKVKTVIEDFELFEFTEDNKFFYSKRMMNNMKMKNEKSEKARLSAEKRWNKTETDANALRTHSEGNAIKESKVKENKLKENIVDSPPNGSTPTKSFKQFSETDFTNEIQQYLSIFGKDLCNQFFAYWTEQSASGKMKFQLEKTWNTKRRLDTWKRNDEKFGGKQQFQKETPVNNQKMKQL